MRSGRRAGVLRPVRWVPVVLAAVLVSGCQDQSPPMMPPASSGPGWAGTLDVDIRDSADLRVIDKGAGVIAVTLQFKSNGFQPFDPAQRFTSSGQIEHLPEAATDLYVAKFSAPAMPSGPCAGQPMSLALSLARRAKNPRVGGGLTIYCGAEVWSGVPARILRLSGRLPKKSAMMPTTP